MMKPPYSIVVLPLLCVVLVPCAANGQGGNRPVSSRGLAMMWSRGQAAGRGPVPLTHAPMHIQDIGQVIPMGLVVGAHVTPIDHMYFEPKDRNAGRYRYDVMAPADGFIVHVQHRRQLEGTSETPREYDDWRVVVEHSGTFYTYYDLLTRMDDAIMKQMKSEPRQPLNYYGRVPVRAGQVIGTVGGRTLDFAVVNTESRLTGLIVPEHYDREPWKIHTVDPMDSFVEPVRIELLRLNPRQAEPRGGKIDYDIDGRVVGNWFREGTNGYGGAGDPRGYWMGHLSFCYHHIDPSKIMVSIGDFEGRPRQFMVTGNGPDPAGIDVKRGVVKYELVSPTLGSSGKPVSFSNSQVHGVMLAQLLETRRLRVEIFPGRTAGDVQSFTRNAVFYER